MDGNLWASLAFTGGPILLMIAIWPFFTGRLGTGKQGSYLARHLVESIGYDFLSLRPALYAAGAGEVRFRNFAYRALP